MDSTTQESFLRSINLVYDASDPASVSHFYPTAKSIPLLEAITGESAERAFFVIAPYGSGKSLTATYALHLIENNKDSVESLSDPAGRIKEISPPYYEYVRRRLGGRKNRMNGVVIALHGSVNDLPVAVKDSALASMNRIGFAGIKRFEGLPCTSMDELALFLRKILGATEKNKIDRIAFLWDEFGKHLETLIEKGRSSDLIELQQLAEIVSRSKKIPVTLTVFMHQGLTRYASNLPQSARSEWNKVGGRFRDIQYVDTSKEIYTLISRIMKSQRDDTESTSEPKPSAAECQKLGLFSEFKGREELKALLADAFPISPVALHLLPRISARVAQNERTLFSFLHDNVGGDSIEPADIYDYFSNEMYADVSVGGVSKQWIQTQEAQSKCDGSPEAVVTLKTACLLGMGLSGERTHASMTLLAAAISHVATPKNTATKIISRLKGDGLLLHRKHTNSITVWHGTDFDLRGKVEDIKGVVRGDFNLIQFLNGEAPAKSWKPLKYNAKHGISRYFCSSYANLADLEDDAIFRLEREDGGYDDAKLIYFIPSNAKDIIQADALLQKKKKPLVGVVIPKDMIAVFEVALEVFCLLELTNDQKFLALDPLLPAEVGQMLDDARLQLHRLIDRLMTPSVALRYYFSGESQQFLTAKDFQEYLSAIMKGKYSKTPFINNELIVRRKVSKPIENARKKLVMGILEQACDKKEFGYTPTEIKTPQASMFRSVLINTGLYDQKRLHFAKPGDLSDSGLRAVWENLQEFFSESGKKELSQVLIRLQKPPYGVRPGLLPVLLAAAYKEFTKSKTVLLQYNDIYLDDILPSTIEEICSAPEGYTLNVVSTNRSARRYLGSLAALFRYGEEFEEADVDPVSKNKELLRQVYEAFEKWRTELPRPAFMAGNVSDDAKAFRELLRMRSTPDVMFLEELPIKMGCRLNDYQGIIEKLKSVIHELTNVVSEYQQRAEDLMQRLFCVEPDNASDSILATARSWASCFPVEYKAQLQDLVALRIFGLIESYQDMDERLIDDIALILIGRPVIHWETATFSRFEDKLTELVSKQNRKLLDYAVDAKDLNAAKIASAQIESLCSKLYGIAGKKNANKILRSILESKSWQP